MIKDNLHNIKKSLPDSVTLVAVSKTKPIRDIQEAYDSGHRDFGENKIQEMAQKYEVLPKDIRWHMIGHVQRNKVKYMAPFVYLIHGVDSVKLLKEIDKQAAKQERVISCLLQARIAEEETKFGMPIPEIRNLLQSDGLKDFTHIKVVGLMGMATFTDDKEQIRKEFNRLGRFFYEIKEMPQTKNFHPTVLSMGMSADYPIAVEEGSTMIRVGSAIFGLRHYIS